MSAGDRRDRAIRGRVLAPGDGAGVTLVLGESLSLWGGLDPATGLIVDVRHPDRGATVTGRVLVMPAARGSSSSASVLAEAVRAGTAPSAIVLGEADLILAIGAAVAEELYGELVPIIVVDDVALARLRDARVVAVEARDGVATITITDGRR